MNARSIITIVLFAACIAWAAEMRTWTSTEGTTIDAKFAKKEAGIVYLETADGSVKTIKLASLSTEDRLHVAELTDPFAAQKAERAKAEAAAPKASEELYALFGDTLRNRGKDKVSVDTLAGKTIGIYFSAHWCPPCRAFTPKLVDFHNKITREGKPFEIVFVSSDRDSNAMYTYMKEMDMPWLTLDFDSEHNGQLKKKYGITGIPTLVIIDAEGKLVTKNGRGDVTERGEDAYDQWN